MSALGQSCGQTPEFQTLRGSPKLQNAFRFVQMGAEMVQELRRLFQSSDRIDKLRISSEPTKGLETRNGLVKIRNLRFAFLRHSIAPPVELLDIGDFMSARLHQPINGHRIKYLTICTRNNRGLTGLQFCQPAFRLFGPPEGFVFLPRDLIHAGQWHALIRMRLWTRLGRVLRLGRRRGWIWRHRCRNRLASCALMSVWRWT